MEKLVNMKMGEKNHYNLSGVFNVQACVLVYLVQTKEGNETLCCLSALVTYFTSNCSTTSRWTQYIFTGLTELF